MINGFACICRQASQIPQERPPFKQNDWTQTESYWGPPDQQNDEAVGVVFTGLIYSCNVSTFKKGSNAASECQSCWLYEKGDSRLPAGLQISFGSRFSIIPVRVRRSSVAEVWMRYAKRFGMQLRLSRHSFTVNWKLFSTRLQFHIRKQISNLIIQYIQIYFLPVKLMFQEWGSEVKNVWR